MALPQPTPPPRARRAALKLLTVMLVIAGILALCEAARWPFLRAPLADALSSALQRDVRLGGDFGLRLLGEVELRSGELVIAAPAQGPKLDDAQGRALPFARAADVELTLPYRTVWQMLRQPAAQPTRPTRWQVRSLEVGELQLTLVRSADGRANWQFGAADAPTGRRAAVPDFEHLVVRNGQLQVDDAVAQLALKAQARTREGSRIATGPPAAEAHAPSAGLSVDAEGRWRGLPLKVSVQSSGLLPLAADAQDADPVPMRARGRIGASQVSLEGQVRDVLQLQALDGRYTLSGPSLAAVGRVLGVTLPTTAAFEMDGRLHKEGAVWHVGARALSIGTSRLAGEFIYDPTEAPSRLTGTLSGARLALPDLGPAIGAPVGADQQPVAATPQRLLPQRDLDIPSLRAMNADVAIAIDRVDLGTRQLDALAPLQGRLTLQDGVLKVERLRAGASGGELRGSLQMDAREAVPRWTADLHMSGVRLERFVKARNPRAAATATAASSAATPGYISGALGGHLQAAGSGQSTAKMLASLDGSMQLWVAGGSVSHLMVELAGIDIAESLGILVRRKDEALPLNCAVASLAIQDGQARTEVGVLDTEDTTLRVDGGLSLVDEKLALRVAASPKDYSPAALRSPVRVEGTFVDPKVRLEVKAIGLRAGAATALATAVAPLAGLLALIDLGEEEKAVCAEALKRMPVKAAKAATAPQRQRAAR